MTWVEKHLFQLLQVETLQYINKGMSSVHGLHPKYSISCSYVKTTVLYFETELF